MEHTSPSLKREHSNEEDLGENQVGPSSMRPTTADVAELLCPSHPKLTKTGPKVRLLFLDVYATTGNV